MSFEEMEKKKSENEGNGIKIADRNSYETKQESQE